MLSPPKCERMAELVGSIHLAHLEAVVNEYPV
jgi:hypothetical protein